MGFKLDRLLTADYSVLTFSDEINRALVRFSRVILKPVPKPSM